jgi:hypothetical protein
LPTYEKPPSAAVLQARARRLARLAEREAEIEWYIENVSNVVGMHLKKRVQLAVELLKTRVVLNISRPVTKQYSYSLSTSVSDTGKVTKKKVWRTKVTDRSKPGEFPKADTTLLMKTIFGQVMEVAPRVYDGFVGTPLDYGVVLELKMQRSFLVRTFEEQYDRIMAILSGPIE